jgi:hypothetical protein
MAILSAIIGFLATLVGGAVTAGKAVVEAIASVMQGVWSVLSNFISNAPRPLKILIFLFLIVTIGNLFSNFFLGMNYACSSTGVLYEAPSIVTGIASAIQLNLFSFTVGDRNTYLANNYNVADVEVGITNVACDGSNVGLYFYTVDLFSYQLWLLVMLLLYGAPMVFSYYSRMGVLH